MRRSNLILPLCCAAMAFAQSASQPLNDLPNPYRTVRDWGRLPNGMTKWPAVSAVEVAPDGSIYVIERCHENSCAGRTEPPILKYDKSGKLVKSWGSGMFVFPHGATVDAQGNLWVTDEQIKDGKGYQVFKFSPDGKLLLTLGKAGVASAEPGAFDEPTDVAVAPDGDIFVTEGHSGGTVGNQRVSKFSKDGKFIKSWGKMGNGPGEFNNPHTIALDSRGRVFVGDRSNNRIQIFDQDGKYLDTWTQFGRPSGIFIAKDDTMYVADSESWGPDEPGWKKGIRIGSAKDGSVKSFIEDMESTATEHSGAEGVGVDAEGNVYGAVVRRQMLEKHIPLATRTVIAPRFEVDPAWPKPLPNHWILGQTVGVSADAQDNVWVIHRPGSLEAGEVHATTNPPTAQCCAPAPPVLEFDPAGNLIGHWGGPGQGYDWPDSNHGITVDYRGNVWIGGNGRGPQSGRGAINGQDEAGGSAVETFHDNMVLKFTRDGKFLLQIGKPSSSKGSNDVNNLRLAAKTFVDPKTNELYVADGYGNHRVIVFDADTGKYKRHWGAYGHRPDDADLGPYKPDAPPAQQFRNPVHCAQLSHDNLLYVCDRVNDRIQVFKPDGTFVKEAFIEKQTLGSGSVWDIAFSQDPQQKYLYVADGENDRVHIVDRDTLEVLTSFGEGGRQPGEFYGVHSIATDSKGNIYTTETYRGQRVQKFVYKGLAAVTTKDQGVVWPRAAK